MAIYHASMKIVGREVKKRGKTVPGRHNSAVAAAAYQGGLKLRDERNQELQDYSRKGGVLFSTVLTPEGAPDWMQNPERLWNAVEFKEDESNRHANAQLARSLDFALPVELTHYENRTLTLSVADEFRKRGMVAQVSIHEPEPENGQRNPHAHILLTMRDVTPQGFGKKNREWNGGWMKEGAPDGCTLKGWRKMIADHTNLALETAGHAGRVDARSFKDQGIDRMPTVHQGKEATALQRRGERTRRGDKQKVVKVLNASHSSHKTSLQKDYAGNEDAGALVARETYERTFDARRKLPPDAQRLNWQNREGLRNQREKSPEPER